MYVLLGELVDETLKEIIVDAKRIGDTII